MSIGTKILNKIVSLAQATGGQVEGNKDVTDEMKNLARTTAEEGVVMLKNDGALPLSESDVVAVFGRVQNDWFYVGYGSGGDVKPPYKVNLIKGLENEGVKIDETLKKSMPTGRSKTCLTKDFGGIGRSILTKCRFPTRLSAKPQSARTRRLSLSGARRAKIGNKNLKRAVFI